MYEQLSMSVEVPDAEVIVRAAGSDILVCAFFSQENGDTDVLVGVEDIAALGSIAALLAQTREVLDSANWKHLSDVAGTAGAESTNENDPPF